METARLWRSLGHYDLQGHFRIDGVTGPDEYSAISDNNLYEPDGAAKSPRRRRRLRTAQDKARELGVTPEEMAFWRAAAEHVRIPYDEQLCVHQQAEGFTAYEIWDFEAPDRTNIRYCSTFPTSISIAI